MSGLFETAHEQVGLKKRAAVAECKVVFILVLCRGIVC